MDELEGQVDLASNPTLCVNLCEVTSPNASAHDLETLLGATCSEAGFPYCERIYVGSYFCENFFLGLSDRFHQAVRELCQRYDLRATLVAPIFGQAFLEQGEWRLAGVLTDFADVYDEVVVNDIGCFAALSRWYAGEGGWLYCTLPHPGGKPPRIGLGRLFSKELRDARYPEVMGGTSHLSLSAEAQACISMQLLMQPDALSLVEVDPLSAVVDVSSIDAGEVAIHLPLCYATTGRNCGPASVDEPDSQKFHLGRGCGRHCLRMVQGYKTDEGVCYVKHGRTYYFENPACRIAGVGSWRVVYAAAHDTMRVR